MPPIELLSRIDFQWEPLGDDLSAYEPCGLVIEAIVEDLASKRALFRRLEAVVARDAVLATNTSSLSVASIASACAASERVVGIHFFNPAPLMPLVEVVPWLGGDPTSAPSALRADAARGARRRCSRRTRRASSSIASRGRSTAKRFACSRRASPTVADDRLGDEGARRVSHGSVRADGLHRQRRELRGDALGLRGMLLRPAVQAVAHAAAAGRGRIPRTESPGAATTTIATARSQPEPNKDPQRRAARSSSACSRC